MIWVLLLMKAVCVCVSVHASTMGRELPALEGAQYYLSAVERL